MCNARVLPFGRLVTLLQDATGRVASRITELEGKDLACKPSEHLLFGEFGGALQNRPYAICEMDIVRHDYLA
jgi:hypothetical protein